MELTRRGRASVGLALALCASAVLLAEPVLLAVAVGVLGWLAGSQLAFLRSLRRKRSALSVTIATTTERPAVDEPSEVELRASASGALSVRLAVTLPAPARIRGGDLVVELDGTAAETAATVEWSVAGAFRVGPATVTASDRQGLFVARFQAGRPLDVAVQSREPQTDHLGRGGEPIAAFGEHRSGRRGPGLEAAELRPYHAGDDLARIDWNATARLQEAYVAESEAETDRRTVLLVDHRATTGAGPAGATPLDYLRHAALAIVESAGELGDPLGCYAVGDEGVTAEFPPEASTAQYDAVATELRTLTPTAPRGALRSHSRRDAGPGATGAVGVEAATERSPAPATASGAGTASTAIAGLEASARPAAPARSESGRRAGRAADGSSADPARAVRAAGRLAGDDSAFGRQLRPLLSDAEPYLHRVAEEPLFATARTYLGRLQGTTWTVVCSDDARPGELRETVKLARRGHDRVLVLLAPRALFGHGLDDLEERYDAYEDATAFRRSLAAMERVAVRELAPGDVVEAVLSAGGGRT